MTVVEIVGTGIVAVSVASGSDPESSGSAASEKTGHLYYSLCLDTLGIYKHGLQTNCVNGLKK